MKSLILLTLTLGSALTPAVVQAAPLLLESSVQPESFLIAGKKSFPGIDAATGQSVFVPNPGNSGTSGNSTFNSTTSNTVTQTGNQITSEFSVTDPDPSTQELLDILPDDSDNDDNADS